MDSRKATLLCCITVCLFSGNVGAGNVSVGNLYAHAEPADVDQVAVTFSTEPANASLYSPEGGLYGATPLTLYYPLPQIWDGCVQLEPLQAKWVSGVESEVRLSACPQNSHDQHHTVVRPDRAGAELDMWFAEKVEQLAMLEASGSHDHLGAPRR